MRLALGLGLRDYVTKNGFGDVVLGISGGIDSALTAALAADALGPERVHTVSMPSRFSSEGTRDDAREVSENLGLDFREVPDRGRRRGLPRGARAALERAGRGEPPGAHPRDAADGAVQHARLARRLDGQQVGDGGRLRDDLRRHGRRVRAPQGRVQDRRLPPRATPERACRARADPRLDDRAAADRRAARRPARRPVAAAVRRARPDPRGVRRARSLARGARSRVRRCARRARARSSSTAPSTSAARRRPG